MDRGAHYLPGLLVRTNRMHRVPHHLQRLKRHHHLIIFNVIPDKHQNFCSWHFASPSPAESFAANCNDITGSMRLKARGKCAAKTVPPPIDPIYVLAEESPPEVQSSSSRARDSS